MREFQDRVAVVTGGASGIGFAMAERFARAGMKLALADVESGPLEAAGKKLGELTDVLAVRTDVADADQMDAFGEAVLERFGGVHLLCNNAGVGGGGVMWELTTQDWEWVIRPNLWGVIHGVRVFVPHLVAQNEGHVVNTASMAGLASIPGMGPYNVTKHAVVTLSETLYGELRQQDIGVGVSVLCPGFVSTRIFESDRNRPEELRNPQGPADDEDREQRRRAAAGFFATAMPAAEVAEQVFSAISEDRFYILTHPHEDAVRNRMTPILENENPAVLPATIFAGRR
jgi:NAD(P)-dependent dehydrogenase (short-subunit alcohol dehydrogenase family)